MFEALSDRLSGVLTRLTGKGALSEDDVKTALREVRVALLEADVSLPVARDFIKTVQDQATGAAVLKSVTPGQQVVKIVHDAMINVLAGDDPDPGALKIDKAGGIVYSKCGTHLGSFAPDEKGDRYCLDLVCLSGRPSSL